MTAAGLSHLWYKRLAIRGARGTGVELPRCARMRSARHIQPIDRLSCAESVLALLAGVDGCKAVPAERMALATVQIETAEQWFSAFMEVEAILAANAFLRMFDSSARMTAPKPYSF